MDKFISKELDGYFLMGHIGIILILVVIWVFFFTNWNPFDRLFKLRAQYKFNQKLNPMQQAFYINNKMPCCGSRTYISGPSGGVMTNIACSKCGKWYNVCFYGPPIIDELKKEPLIPAERV